MAITKEIKLPERFNFVGAKLIREDRGELYKYILTVPMYNFRQALWLNKVGSGSSYMSLLSTFEYWCAERDIGLYDRVCKRT